MSVRGGIAERNAMCDHASERGAAAMSIIVMTSVLLLAFAMVVGVRLSKATDQASGLQAAADASALAGAQAIVDRPVSTIFAALVKGEVSPASWGHAEARNFAHHNDAAVVPGKYHFNADQGRVQVTVRSKEVLESGQHEERSAVAELGLNICREPEPPAPPTPRWPASGDISDGGADGGDGDSDDEAPPPQPELPEDEETTVDCGDLTIEYTGSWKVDQDDNPEWTSADLEWDGWDFSGGHIDVDLEPTLVE